MKTVITALIAAALLVAGAFVAVAVSDNGVATAQEDPGDTPSEGLVIEGGLRDILDELVADGVIDEAQADAVYDAIAERGFVVRRHLEHHFGGFDHLDEAARLFGIDVADIIEQLRDGSTLAEIAEANDIDLDVLVDQFVAAAEERLNDAVAGDRMTQEEADELLADLRERIEAFLNGDFFNEFQFNFGEGFPEGFEFRFGDELPEGLMEHFRFRFGDEFGEGFRFDGEFPEGFHERFGEGFTERFREFSERFENGDTSFRGFGRGFGPPAETPADSA